MSREPSPAISDLQSSMSGLRVALVHEWLSGIAGSEQTFVAMAEMLPDASLFALSMNNERGLDLGSREVSTSYLNRVAQSGGRAALLPLMPGAMKRLGRGRDFDVVITSSHAFSRAFASRSDATHLSYTYTPVRYVWYPDLERHRSRVKVPAFALAPFRRADLKYARDVHAFAGISREISDRIRDIYGRESSIVHPPCETTYFSAGPTRGAKKHGAVIAGRLVSYKRVDLAIEACALAGIDLTVIGSGPDQPRLQALADRVFPGRVEFRGSVSRPELREAYQLAQVVLCPGLEDFGIVPVEAQATGTAVVAYGAAGALETVLPHQGGHVKAQDPALFAAAIEQTVADPPSEEACLAHAERFSRAQFDERFASWVADSLDLTI